MPLNRIKDTLLLDYYGNLLTKHQKDILEEYFNEDLSMNEIADKNHLANAGKLRNIYSTYMKNVDAITLGAYKAGSDPRIDEAIKNQPLIEAFIKQGINEACPFEASVAEIAKIAGGK